MPAFGHWRVTLCVGVFAWIASPALAQHVILDAPGFLQPKPKADLPTVRAPTAVWPRLDPGAVVCQTEDDLDRHAANTVARVSGGEMQTANCRVIGQTVGIKIVNREGPGRTQVQLTAPGGETGWTDAWLPDKPPPR